MTKFLNISTDNTLGGNSPSDAVVSSQKAIKTALNAKANSADLATVATSGSYNDLSNKPTIPAAQVNSDWNANSGVARILNKPTLATVATSGSYADLSNKPTIPTVNNATLTIQKNGTTVQTFTANQSTNATANISVPTKTSEITNNSGFITSSALAPYALSADLATVATSGSYNDLTDTPVIPSMNNRVNGAPLSNSASVFYGVSTSAKTVVDKIVSIPSITTLDAGTTILVKPTVTSTVANSGIKLNDFPAYPMRAAGAAITTSTDSIVWAANIPSWWVFDGEYWIFAGHGTDANTTYSAMSVAEGITGTATSSRAMTAANTKQIIQGTTLTNIDVTTTGAVTNADSITSGIGKLQATKADKSELPTVGNGTITITQGGVSKGTFTTNQSGNTTIALDAGGGSVGWGSIVGSLSNQTDLWSALTNIDCGTM